MRTQIFKSEARERLMTIHSSDGAERFDRVERFAEIAEKAGTPLVVPPNLDQDLHEILCDRDAKGVGLEARKVGHQVFAALGETIGKSLREINHPLVSRTVEILEKNGFQVGTERYENPACTFAILN